MSKTFTRLVDEVCFEAGATGLSNLEPVAGIIIEEVLNECTGQAKYDDLFVRDQTLVVTTLATGKLALPADYQHIDWDSFHIRFLGDATVQQILKPLGRRVTGNNVGTVRYYTRDSVSIYVYPYGELDPTDVFILNYWRLSNAKTNNLIVPDQLVATVKAMAIARLGMAIGNKLSPAYIGMGRESHSASMGATDLPPL